LAVEAGAAAVDSSHCHLDVGILAAAVILNNVTPEESARGDKSAT
jgi:hypothetical protein